MRPWSSGPGEDETLPPGKELILLSGVGMGSSPLPLCLCEAMFCL